MGFQDSCRTFSVPGLVILAASIFFRYRVEKQTNKQTNGGKYLSLATSADVGNKYKYSKTVSDSSQVT